MFNLDPLPYDYAALEPFVDEATMRFHHDKHHQAYCDKLNASLEQFPELYDRSAESLVTELDQLPEEIRLSVRNGGGGYVNHNFFWQSLRPHDQTGANREGEAAGKLGEEITNTFGDKERFKQLFKDKALALFGSGWTWLVTDDSRKLEILNLPNQDSPLTLGKRPLMALDVWEHAYYLKYQNRRADYIDAWFNLVNWEKAEELYQS